MKILTFALVTSLWVSALNSSPNESIYQPSHLLLSSELTQNDQNLLILYGGQKTRTPLVQWYLEELGVPYQYVELDISKDENHQAEFLSINPMGKVPAIKMGSFTLWESGAILLYLSEKYSQENNSLENRSTINQWIIFANATLSPSLFIEEKRLREMPKLLTALNKILTDKSFLVGEQLTAGDVAVVSYLYYAEKLMNLDYSAYPAIVDYLQRMTSRSAFQKTLGKS